MDSRRLLLAFALSLGVLLLYERFVLERYAKPVAPASAPIEVVAEPPQLGVEPSAVREPVAAGMDRVTVETDLFRAGFTPVGARLVSLELKRFRRTVAADSPPLELVQQAGELPFRLDLGGGQDDAAVSYLPNQASIQVRGNGTQDLVFTGATSSGITLEKRYTFRGDSYLFDLAVSAAGARTPSTVGLVLAAMPSETHQGGGHEMAVELVDGKLVQHAVSSLVEADEAPAASGSPVRWAGFAAQYFLAAAIPGTPASARMTAVTHLAPSGPCPDEDLACTEGAKRGWRCRGSDQACDGSGTCSGCLRQVPIVRLDAASEGGRTRFGLYFGPKDRSALAQAGHDLDRSIDFGYFWFIALPLLEALRLLHDLTRNWGVAIILLTTLVKVATIPLTQATYRQMKEMQKIQPQMQRIRERFKDDSEALQREMMELYRRHRVNPLSGCLPMLLQIPIFIGLYNALNYSIELRHAPFALWINDLSAPDRLMVLGIGIPVLTLIMGGTMFVQQWLTPAQGDPTQQRVMMIMPVIFTFMFINFPAGLVLYWLVNNVITIAQQYAMVR